MIASCRCQGEKLRSYSTREGVSVATSVETLGVDLRTQTMKQREKKEVRCEILAHEEKSGLPEE